MSKGEMGIREVVILIIFIALLVVDIIFILAIRGELGNFIDKLNVPVLGELFK